MSSWHVENKWCLFLAVMEKAARYRQQGSSPLQGNQQDAQDRLWQQQADSTCAPQRIPKSGS
jgi:hypothetical protein